MKTTSKRAAVLGATTALLATGLVQAAPATAQGGPVGGIGSTYYLNDAFSGQANTVFSYGEAADQVFVGDWDGDGIATLMIRRGNAFYVRDSNSSGPADHVFTYGNPGDVVLAGDWDGDGIETLAVRRGNVFHVKNDTVSGPADVVFGYGNPGDVVLVGDWDGDWQDTLAVRRGNQYLVKNDTNTGVADAQFTYGDPGDIVLVGYWNENQDGDTIAVRRGNVYHFRYSLTSGRADQVVGYGENTDAVMVGDWNGDGIDTLGVRRVHGPTTHSPTPTPTPQSVALAMTGDDIVDWGLLPSPVTATQGSTMRFELPQQYDSFTDDPSAWDANGVARQLFPDGFHQSDGVRTFEAQLDSTLEPGTYSFEIFAGTSANTHVGRWSGTLTITAGPSERIDVPLHDADIDRWISTYDLVSEPGRQLKFTAPAGKSLANASVVIVPASGEPGFLDDSDLGTTLAPDNSSITITLPSRDKLVETLGPSDGYYVEIYSDVQSDDPQVVSTSFALLFDLGLAVG